MRSFDYSKYKKYTWDNEILNYLTLIYEFKGKQELYLRQKPVEIMKVMNLFQLEVVLYFRCIVIYCSMQILLMVADIK